MYTMSLLIYVYISIHIYIYTQVNYIYMYEYYILNKLSYSLLVLYLFAAPRCTQTLKEFFCRKSLFVRQMVTKGCSAAGVMVEAVDP